MLNMYRHLYIDMGKTTDYQKARALLIVDEDKIQELVANTLYLVPSSRPNHQGYYVYYGTPRACNCDHFYFESQKGVRHPVCSHIKAVGYFRGNKQ